MPFNPLFETAISTARFSTYRSIARDDDHAWDLYRWNIDLSAALVPLIVDLEVALRNTIHEQLTSHLGRPDWWANDTLVLDDATQRGLMNVIAKHQKHIIRGTTGAGRVIAELMLGTWVCLLGRGGTSSLGRTIDYEANLWRPALRHGFSNGLTRPTRDDVHKRADLVRALRNRSAHHEPIFDGVHRPGAAKHAPKVQLHHVWEQTIELLEWINPALAAHHQTANLLPNAIAARPA